MGSLAKEVHQQSDGEPQGLNHGKQQILEIGEIILEVGEQKNRWEWMKDRVIHHVKGRDAVV